MKIFWIDLFSGAGGTTTGIHLANMDDVNVVACVNHDAMAIESHKSNHPDCLHLVEDVRDLKVVKALKNLTDKLRNKYPNCIINIWASLECTNYSKAKGGQPRDADSRTLAYALYMYLESLNPDYLYIENVREFMSWGPLDENGRPISRKNGTDYIAWINEVCNYGYTYDWQLLNSADFGSYTSRERYFGIFAKHGMPVRWPEPTHTKKPVKNGLFESLKKWKPVREVLDLDDEGVSIFNRKTPLVDATLNRIYAGLVKFVDKGDKNILVKYNSMNKKGKYKSPDINNPSPVVSCQNRLGIATIKCAFMDVAFSGDPKSKVKSLDTPSGTITCKDHHSIVQTFLTSYYGNGNAHSTNEPCPTITTKDRFSNVFIDQQYGQSKPISCDETIGTLTANPKFNVVHSKHWLLNPSWGGHSIKIDDPCPVIVARQDKAPLYIISAEIGNFSIAVNDDDSPVMIKIKEFMAKHGIVDIKMRMLKVSELLKIQGFPEDYILKGTKTDQKKFIGNAVVPVIAKALTLANALSVKKLEKIAI